MESSAYPGNHYTEVLFDYSGELLVNQSIDMLISEREQPKFSECYVHFLKKNQMTVPEGCFDITGLRHNQIEFPMELSLGTWNTSGESLTIILLRDLTHHSQLCNKNQALEHSNRTKDQFLTTMSHQLRTPLNAVLGFSEIMLMKLAGELTAEQEKHLNVIHKSGKHLLDLINDLSDLAKIDAGEVSLSITQFNAQELIGEIMNSLSPLAKEKPLLFTAQLPEDKITFNSDKLLLTQIITNIINNALKFTSEGSVLVKLRETHDKAILDIIDTGVGIKEEKMPLLFEPFQQLFIAEKKNEGSGLGLHISKKLADLINIKLDVTSQYDKGTQFALTIPTSPN